jgi:uncharacterized RDD family membrane protein YckC
MAEWKTYGQLTAAPAPAGASAATVQQATADPASSGLRLRRDEPAAPAAEREATCSQCGAAAPVSQLMTVGASQLCPRCQASYRRLSFSGPDRPLEYAPPLVRLAAYLLDCAICGGVAGVIVVGALLVLKHVKPDPAVATLMFFGVLAGLIVWILNYFVGKIAREGATPMMKAFGIKVARAGGGAVGGGRALGRLLMIGLVNQFTFGLGHVVAFFDKERRALHDMVCGTVVIKS